MTSPLGASKHHPTIALRSKNPACATRSEWLENPNLCLVGTDYFAWFRLILVEIQLNSLSIASRFTLLREKLVKAG